VSVPVPDCCLAEKQCEHWKQFDNSMIVARCRGLLTTEARGIATRLIIDETFTPDLLRHRLILAIEASTPRSRLIPWELNDAAVEMIIEAVIADVTKTWT
jgi:hypothetical protein